MSFVRTRGGTRHEIWEQAEEMNGTPCLCSDALLSDYERVVVVAPHPDDEVIAFGGLLQRARELNLSLLLVSVTRGEACYPGSSRWTPPRLGMLRMDETARAMAKLGWTDDAFDWIDLDLPDTRVHEYKDELASTLISHSRKDDLILTTWRNDGHIDHKAVGETCAEVARSQALAMMEAPVWALHWAKPDEGVLPWNAVLRLPLSEESLLIKKQALTDFESQLLGDDGCHIPPILLPEVMERACMPFEVLIR